MGPNDAVRAKEGVNEVLQSTKVDGPSELPANEDVPTWAKTCRPKIGRTPTPEASPDDGGRGGDDPAAGGAAKAAEGPSDKGANATEKPQEEVGSKVVDAEGGA